MNGEKDRWVQCYFGRQPHRHWGQRGAAGLFLVSEDNALLQLRADWAHMGGSWALPGGAIASGETPLQAALRETAEETGLFINPAEFDILGDHVFDHGHWKYTTIVARTRGRPEPRITDNESEAARWVPFGEIAALDLHPAFAGSVPALLEIVHARDRPSSLATPRC